MTEQTAKDRQAASPTFRERWSAQPWWEGAILLASEIESTTELCANMALPIAEVKALWLSHREASKILLELRNTWLCDPIEMEHLGLVYDQIDGELHVAGVKSPQIRWQLIQDLFDLCHNDEMRTLKAGVQAFSKAFYRRGDDSAQSKYAEARLASRRVLKEGHNPLLDGCLELVEMLRKVCSQEVAGYMTDDVGLELGQFLEILHMLAHDRADPAKVANPPARIRAALSRQQRRKNMIDRVRWMTATREQAEGREDPENFASKVEATLDWERGKRRLSLPPDQIRAIESRIEGNDLQSSNAPEDLEWDAARVARVRRSLEPDRRWGKKLRQHFRHAFLKNQPAQKTLPPSPPAAHRPPISTRKK